MKVRMTITVEVDPETWEQNYGIDKADRKRLRQDVEAYCFSCVADSEAAINGSMEAVR
jgi:hypothetical protein